MSYNKMTSILNAIENIKDGSADKYAVLHDLQIALLDSLTFLNIVVIISLILIYEYLIICNWI